ncbi:hypothetical protein [Exercitatus varius]|uniref:hypothetical protein n=1 Tax=Exercitatus varius TaxID=67857 RepID=UPI00294A9EB4|nr:hypothetical protein [Exercitatus varius]MDG2961706.1 hypothetical protein [Exercitatus varius]
MMKASFNVKRLKNILGFIGILILAVLASLFLGYVAVTFFPGVNIQQWFQHTKLFWFAIRLVIYGIIGGLVHGIHHYQPLSRKAIGLLVLGIMCFETLNILYIIG